MQKEIKLNNIEDHPEIVNFFTSYNITNLDHDYTDIMVLAVKTNRLDVVKFLVENNANIHAYDDFAVQIASKEGNLEILKYLESKGADIHVDDDVTIQVASEKGHLDIVKFLVENKANIHTNNDCSVYWASRNNHHEVVKFLVSRNANTSALTPFHDLLPEDEEFISDIVSKGCCLDMSINNKLVSNVRKSLTDNIDQVLQKYKSLILNIRKNINH